MKRFCTLICLICIFFGNLYAQYTLEEGLDRIPFSKLPYKERYLPEGRENSCFVEFHSSVLGRMYSDLQCKKFSMANKMIDFTPVVYLKIALPDHSMLGALSFGGVTDYRTDVLFIQDLKRQIRDTLECCVTLDELPVKQYEVCDKGEVIVYEMIFDYEGEMPDLAYGVEAMPLTGHIHKTTYFIAPTKQFVKMKEEDTDTRTFSSLLLNDHNLWDETAFGMTYKKCKD